MCVYIIHLSFRKIRLFPSGDWQAKPGFFSMYLMLSNLIAHPKGAQVYVEYEMAVLSQLEAVPPVKETCNWLLFTVNCHSVVQNFLAFLYQFLYAE